MFETGWLFSHFPVAGEPRTQWTEFNSQWNQCGGHKLDRESLVLCYYSNDLKPLDLAWAQL